MFPLLEYITYREELCNQFQVYTFFQFPIDEAPVTHIIKDFRIEVPELWVRNTTKQVSVVIKHFLTGKVDSLLMRESTGDSYDKFIDCLRLAFPSLVETTREEFFDQVFNRIELCYQDLPGIDNIERERLYYGSNLMYFYRAFEDILNVNIVIFKIMKTDICNSESYKKVIEAERPPFIIENRVVIRHRTELLLAQGQDDSEILCFVSK